jgi:hypothetical protein
MPETLVRELETLTPCQLGRVLRRCKGRGGKYAKLERVVRAYLRALAGGQPPDPTRLSHDVSGEARVPAGQEGGRRWTAGGQGAHDAIPPDDAYLNEDDVLDYSPGQGEGTLYRTRKGLGRADPGVNEANLRSSLVTSLWANCSLTCIASPICLYVFPSRRSPSA